MAIVDPRSLSPEAQEALRHRAVAMVLQQQEPIGRTAGLLGVSRMSVSSWVKAVRTRGAAALAAQPRGRKPGHTKLSPGQVKRVLCWVRDRCPDQLKLPFYLWTQEAVQVLAARRLGVTVSRSTAGRMLRANGFSAQKPVRRALEQNPLAVQQWLAEDYPLLAAQAQADKAVILWADELGMRWDHQTGTSYSPVGQTPVIPGTGQRFGCNMISALSNRGQLQFMIFKGKFHGGVCLNFLRRLLKNNLRKVDLIWDGHPVHRSRKVGKFVAEHAAKLRVFRLPRYRPELNPDELVNHDVKSNLGPAQASAHAAADDRPRPHPHAEPAERTGDGAAVLPARIRAIRRR